MEDIIQNVVHSLLKGQCNKCPYDYSNGHDIPCDMVASELSINAGLKYLYDILTYGKNKEICLCLKRTKDYIEALKENGEDIDILFMAPSLVE